VPNPSIALFALYDPPWRFGFIPALPAHSSFCEDPSVFPSNAVVASSPKLLDRVRSQRN